MKTCFGLALAGALAWAPPPARVAGAGVGGAFRDRLSNWAR